MNTLRKMIRPLSVYKTMERVCSTCILVFLLSSCTSPNSDSKVVELKPALEEPQIVSKTRTNNDDTEYTMFYEYNDHGECVHELGIVNNFAVSGLKIDGGYEIVREHSDNTIVEKHYNANGLITERTFTYDDSGKLIERVDDAFDGKTRITYHYDSDGHLLSEYFFNSKGENSSEEQYHYEAGIIKTKTTRYNDDHVTLFYSYNNGLLEKITREDGSDYEVYVYNDDGLLIELKQSSFGSSFVTFKYEYNDDNKLIKEAKYGDKGEFLYSLDYKYDYIYETIDNPAPVFPEDYIVVSVPKNDPTINMSKSQVLDSNWGKPNYKNIIETRYGIHEQWVYSKYGFIYFDNGYVSAIQYRSR